MPAARAVYTPCVFELELVALGQRVAEVHAGKELEVRPLVVAQVHGDLRAIGILADGSHGAVHVFAAQPYLCRKLVPEAVAVGDVEGVYLLTVVERVEVGHQLYAFARSHVVAVGIAAAP